VSDFNATRLAEAEGAWQKHFAAPFNTLPLRPYDFKAGFDYGWDAMREQLRVEEEATAAHAQMVELLTKNLADVCNALADALGLPAEQIDPNRLPEHVKELEAKAR
jgi:Arc/MetJ family transcription regulator